MRTDVKIGIAVGLFVVLVVVVYFVVTGGGGQPEPKPQDEKLLGKPKEPGDSNVFGLGHSSADTGTGSTEDAGHSGNDETVIVRRESPRSGEGGDSTPTETGADTGTRTTTDTDSSRRTSADDSAGTARTSAGAIEIDQRTPEPAGATRERIYVVKAGDAGFWGIAAKEYGHGKHWTVIARANPKADPNNLQPGQKLLLPPLPRKTDAPRGTREAAPLGTPQGGGKYYIVKKTDTQGFWGIAAKEYGHGKHWTVIARANPKADPNNLQPGQKLLLPPLPKKTDSPRSTRTTTPTGTSPSGGRYYIIKETDTQGFWGIAKKEYGHGKHADIITRANPNVDPRRLRAGQRIILPKLTEATKKPRPAPKRRSAEPHRPTPAAATADDQPYFPEYAQ